MVCRLNRNPFFSAACSLPPKLPTRPSNKKYTPQPPGLMVCISSIIYSTYPDCIHCIPDIFVRGQRETDSQGYPVVLCSDVR